MSKEAAKKAQLLLKELTAQSDVAAEENLLEAEAKNSLKHIREQLINLRSSKNLKQKELADYLGVSQSAISKIENGSGDIGWQTLYRVCRALGYTPSVTLTDNSSPLSTPTDAFAEGLLSAANFLNEEQKSKHTDISEYITALTEKHRKLIQEIETPFPISNNNNPALLWSMYGESQLRHLPNSPVERRKSDGLRSVLIDALDKALEKYFATEDKNFPDQHRNSIEY